MSGGETNKIVGSILVALLAIVGINVFVNEISHREEPEEMAYMVDVGEGAERAPAAEEEAEEPAPEPVVPLLAAADPAAGEREAKKCGACHSFDQGGPNKVGPNLWNVVGSDIASHEGFSYSGALQELEGEWTFEKLNGFLADPKEYAPGTKMSFAGVRSVEDRADLIAYLRQRADNPVPLP